MRHAIGTLLSGIADFRRKKHGNLCSSPHYPTAQGRIKRVCWDKQGKSLDTAAIKLFVGFYKNCVAIFYTYEKILSHKKRCEP
jgi:hypothetical protein